MWKDYDNTDWDNWEYDENDDETSPQPSPLEEREQENIIVKDWNWNILQEGDSVAAIKDLKVKWSKDIKRWDKFTKIRLTDDVWVIESWKMVLKTEFLKKI